MLFPAIGFPRTSDTGGFFIGKKEIHAAGEYFAPTTSEVYAPTHAPQLQFAPVTSYGYQGATTIISSPGAEAKKAQIMDVVSKPKMRGEWDLPIEVAQAPEHTKDISGTNLPLIAGIAVVGAVAIMFLKKKI
jgi:hypothetical protein